MGPFWDLIAKADNIPIVLMGPLFALALGYSLIAARRNDRRLAEGGEGAVKRAMDGPPLRSGEDLPGAKVHTWPHLLKIELVGGLILLLILIVWSIVIDAPLEQEADPSRTPNPSKAPWYFLGLQEMLVYFDPWIAGVALPTLAELLGDSRSLDALLGASGAAPVALAAEDGASAAGDAAEILRRLASMTQHDAHQAVAA